ncbi:MAG: hypothetical protein AAGF11_34395 [Myxococcota bacterium]
MGAEPGSCDLLDPSNGAELATTRQATVDAITSAFNSGFHSMIISLGGEIDAVFLQTMANAGIGAAKGGRAIYWEATSRPELSTVVAEILLRDHPCRFAIDDPVSNEIAPACNVMVNYVAVTYEDPDGWTLADSQTLQLQGAACNSIQNNQQSTIDMVCDCSS